MGRDHDLYIWMRDVEEVVREIMGDECFKGHQNFSFEACLEDDCQANVSVSLGVRQTQGSHFRLVKSGDVHTCPDVTQDIPGYP